MTNNDEGKIKIVKGVIFLFTALIFLGVGMAVYGISRGKNNEETSSKANGSAFDPITIQAKKGASIKQLSECGKMICMVIGSKNGESVLIISPTTGELKGSINLVFDEVK